MSASKRARRAACCGLRVLGGCLSGILFAGYSIAQPAPPARILSINMCTDQLLLDLVPRERIIGLSPFAGDTNLSWAARQATGLPVLSGTAEEVMMLKPDLVVGWRFTKRATREFIRQRAIVLAEFDSARTLEETKAQIARFGEITGTEAQAALRIAEIEAAAAELRLVAAVSRLKVLPLSRRGWVAGQDNVLSDILDQAGLINVASEIGLQHGGFIALETIVKLKPDAIVIAHEQVLPEDQGSAMLLHPAIQGLFPPERRIIVPERLTVCGGPMLAEAIRLLAAQISKVKPRAPPADIRLPSR